MLQFKEEIARAISNVLEMNFSDIIISIEIPKEKEQGDYAFPCFRLAKILKKSPQLIAEEINSKIFDYLQEIVFDMYLIFEFEIFDENKLYKENPKNEYERLYNLNKTLNLVIKTRIVWEKLMNFMYLAIEREDIEKKVSKSKSKKAIFKK